MRTLAPVCTLRVFASRPVCFSPAAGDHRPDAFSDGHAASDPRGAGGPRGRGGGHRRSGEARDRGVRAGMVGLVSLPSKC